ncbi:dimeric dUTPase (all-alpha-NTP-PPase superfamily) [Bacillus tianshenii]|uniref:Dimeric dUTPase (All-alpha-NTP-PPase superfamily) n=1 Tax=Sutcliffiella tianshenii TaxID=1463404 RepID=A0ABS2P0P0_9BACI|nr:dUTP diphosphatase [Bacillus tianshenii]MBM7620532.1 dimeric dUTPase (all-alpha-NTP-PPase superfamily) [Bacillus tianshenii]
MGLKELYKMQKELDSKIEEQHGLVNMDLVDRKILALLVELGELANETRCFKFWSVKPASEQSVVLEEYVDGVHFLLSVGLTLGYTSDIPREVGTRTESLNEQFLILYDLISMFRLEKQEEPFQVLFATYMELGEMLGFSWDEVVAAYMEKNLVNHKRQQQGY